MGNPSDGFNGKTISMLLHNFYALVTLEPSDRLTLVRHPEHDRTDFASLADCHRYASVNGYYGGLRLIQAVCKKFAECCERAMVDPARLRRNFRLSYDTNIPRMVGLSGSSAIVTAAFRALLRFYDLSTEDLGIPKPLFPQVILDVEMSELSITAGLQDRVIQVYGGLVHMDFSKQHLDKLGHGRYQELPVDLLPPLYLAYDARAAGDSGKVHSNVRQRWLSGDPVIRQGMTTVAGLADSCAHALREKRYGDLAGLMRENFRNRRLMYGDEVVGSRNIEMIELAAVHGMAAKFTGSGGAIVCVRDFGPGQSHLAAENFEFSGAEEHAIEQSFSAHGFAFLKVKNAPHDVEPHVHQDTSTPPSPTPPPSYQENRA